MRRLSKVSLVILITYFLSIFNLGMGFNLGPETVSAKSTVSFVKSQNYEKFKPQELIVSYKSNAKDKELTNKRLKAIVTQRGSLGVEKVKLPGDISVEAALKAYSEDPNVEYAHLNYTYQQLMVPNDTYYGYQWNMPNIKAEEAWDISQSVADISVAIIDSGVDLNHPDLKANIVAGWNFVASNGIPQDDNGHGTHVAGIAAAVTNNSMGVAGLAGNAKIMPVKVLNSAGQGYDFDIAEGIMWAADNGADIINLSLGGPSYSQTLQSAVDYAFNKGVLVVAASGNDGLASVSYPAKYSSVMAVSATEQTNNIASFSNYGPEIEVSAPGVQIASTYWAGESTYAYADGTSMASPMVAGLAALVWSSDLTMTNTEIRELLRSTSDDLGTSGFDNQYGYGKINAYNAVYRAANRISPEPPKLNVMTPVEGTLTNQAVVEVEGTAYGADLVKVQGQEVVPVGDGYFNATIAVKEGANQILIEAVNNYGTVSETRNITVDLSAPLLEVINPIDGLTTTEPTIDVIGFTEIGAKLMINGSAVILGSDGSFLQPVTLVKGDNVINIKSIDKAGNESVITRTVTLLTGKKSSGGGGSTPGGNGKGNKK